MAVKLAVAPVRGHLFSVPQDYPRPPEGAAHVGLAQHNERPEAQREHQQTAGVTEWNDGQDAAKDRGVPTDTSAVAAGSVDLNVGTALCPIAACQHALRTCFLEAGTVAVR